LRTGDHEGYHASDTGKKWQCSFDRIHSVFRKYKYFCAKGWTFRVNSE
jgi:hypothetical protein